MSTSISTPTSRAQALLAITSSEDIHPDYAYWAPLWETIRDAEIGEVEIKRKNQKYLPKLQAHDIEQYRSYLLRAVFYNMTAKTINALYGTVFRRNPKVTGFTPALTNASKKFSKDGMSLSLTAKTAVKEVLTVGRYGMLVDADPEGRGNAYVATYTAENILDWHTEEIAGEWKFTRVVLREISYNKDRGKTTHNFTSRFRVLVLNEVDGDYVYEQHIYDDNETHAIPDLSGEPSRIIIPEVRGEALDYIPFIIIGSFTNNPDIQKPPLLDIVTLNLSHYMSYAQLEQGRHYTANPVYWTSGASDGDSPAEYYVGPDVVWELGKDGKAGLIEFNGSGLMYLENALQQKEMQIAAIGGRMMPGTSKASAESDNALKLKEANEATLLLNIADTVDEAMTIALGWYADWNNATATVIATLTFELNRDFMLKDIGAREFRAIHQMYSDGLIPIDVLYDYLLKSEVIPQWMGIEEYKTLISDAKQFPHMVDVLAQMKNFPNAKAFHEYRLLQEAKATGEEGGFEVIPDSVDPVVPPTPPQALMATGRRPPNGDVTNPSTSDDTVES